jgi:hypothetical protein
MWIRELIRAWAFWLPVIAIAGWLCLSTAHAVQPTADEKAACYPDAARYCQSAMHNLFPMLAVFACLMDHRQQLSARCSAVFKAHGY